MNSNPAGMEVQRYDWHGFPVTPMSIAQTVEYCRASWKSGAKNTILFQNLHTMFLQTKDDRYRRSYDGAVALIDGTPLVHLLRRAGHAVEEQDRAPAIDLIDPVLAATVTDGTRVFVIGQEEHVLHEAMARLRAKHDGLKIAGHHGFFDTDGPAADHVIEAANDFGADVVLVGLGSPKSEVWIYDNRDGFDASIVWACGALMEYVAGYVPTPPRWSGAMGLEWLFRLANDPKRFLARYFAEPIWLAAAVGYRKLRP